eukprot:5690283-Amphidinium_carterae.1
MAQQTLSRFQAEANKRERARFPQNSSRMAEAAAVQKGKLKALMSRHDDGEPEPRPKPQAKAKPNAKTQTAELTEAQRDSSVSACAMGIPPPMTS